MRIGELRFKASFQTVTRAASADGYTESWSEQFAPSVSVEPATAGRVARVFGGQLQVPVASLVTLRDRPDLTRAQLEKARVVYDGRTLQVLGWQRVHEAGQWLVLACEELVL